MRFFLTTILGRLLVFVLGRTLRTKIEGEDPGTDTIYAFWHGTMFPLIYTHRNRGINVLVSEYRDGEHIARIIKSLGYKTIRGSNTNSGMKPFLELFRLEKGECLAITPDGPKGPRHKVKEGIVRIAKHTQMPIMPVAVKIEKKITFGSWDKWALPLPFSRCTISFGEPIHVNENIEGVQSRLEEVLNSLDPLCNENNK